jgi:tetratricopeptide (TPR) repeat protein
VDDVMALCDLGRARLAMEALGQALIPLERAAAIAPQEPRAHFLLGLVLLRSDRPQEASAALRHAGTCLVERGHRDAGDEQLEYEVTLALAHTRLALDDPEGALLTAEAGLALKRRDVRAILAYSDALVAAGRPQEAEARLEAALAQAGGVFAQEIRRRLASLARSR